ncbi:hypothetical protein [Haloarcula nitratireducens]|uniref:AAA ATPase AAA+ lid domain-containing protein n=1 Tax=Haloarcula nitratireducens TaxID=2487749 RepID=A0AAW4PFP4_9EURY|nr:hypothetical protein [Halomicroarcula nitratireducens]MBX0297231.1 hypothetical protein [Halomicroarcula nitratireducens]
MTARDTRRGCLQTLADQTEGLSSADIIEIVDDAAMHAAELDADVITHKDLTATVSEAIREGRLT